MQDGSTLIEGVTAVGFGGIQKVTEAGDNRLHVVARNHCVMFQDGVAPVRVRPLPLGKYFSSGSLILRPEPQFTCCPKKMQMAEAVCRRTFSTQPCRSFCSVSQLY